RRGGSPAGLLLSLLIPPAIESVNYEVPAPRWSFSVPGTGFRSGVSPSPVRSPAGWRFVSGERNPPGRLVLRGTAGGAFPSGPGAFSAFPAGPAAGPRGFLFVWRRPRAAENIHLRFGAAWTGLPPAPRRFPS